jgi:uncharacterized protein (TIGR02266 family)
MNAHLEKRDYVRAPIQLKVECLEIGDASNSLIHFSTTNVSVGGVFLETERSFQPGTKLTMTIKLTHPEMPLNTVGTVMWFSKSSRESLNGMGISLEFQNEHDRKLLESFIINELANRL